MRARRIYPDRFGRRAAWLLAIGLCLAMAQSSVCVAQAPVKPGANSLPGTESEVTLDRVVAIVNGDLILESDVDEEARFAAFQPFSGAKPVTRDQLLDRLIDRTLILQQLALQPEPPIMDVDVDTELASLRKTIPKCAAYHCDTEAGWQKFVADQGFTMKELRERWRLRMTVLRFIEERFRMGIRISQTEIDDYYKKTLVPMYQKESVPAPSESSVEDRIQEILLQQQVDKLLDDWLAALRAQGTVRILKPGEEAP
jgi:peptidyl-prolyl cis-trans isomerase SurA